AAAIEDLQKQLADKPDDLDMLFQLCSHQMLHSKFNEAMDTLLRIIKLDYAWRDGIASLCLRGLFIMLGKDNPDVIEYRQKLIDQQAY
ncbi:MAG: tetratricopeptide repeat protein, partial [Gammaproteobacteria bacterium]|nr:tetratricopeptide repeat protein [Gammaproteobacteria bacterium]